jgi:hypothetical protein
MKPLCVFLWSASIACLLGCQRETSSSLETIEAPRVLFVLEPDYDVAVQKLKLTPREAALQIVNYRKENGPQAGAIFVGGHYLLVGDEYVFGMRHKLGYRLGGCYVDGNTGTVRSVESLDYIPTADKPEWAALIAKASKQELKRRVAPLSDGSGDEIQN